MEREKPDFPDPVKLVIEETIPRLTSGRSLDDMNHDFIITHSKSLSHLMAGKYLFACRSSEYYQ